MNEKATVACLLALSIASSASAQSSSKIDDDGTLKFPESKIPFSDLASDELRRNLVEVVRAYENLGKLKASSPMKPGETAAQFNRRMQDEGIHIPGAARLRSAFDVDIRPAILGGVPVEIFEPKNQRSYDRDRVLINLHAGGFAIGARYGGQMESVPIAAQGFKVVSVDYRLAPEHRFPAASEDVAAVYKELLKTYRAGHIGIYGCSAGGMLSAQATSWFQSHDLPRPGAIGVFGSGSTPGSWGDSNHFGPTLSGFRSLPADAKVAMPYFDVPNLDLKSALVSPTMHPEVLARFPPTLLITGTRDQGLSSAAFMHARLLDAGVDASLYVIEGGSHCSFAAGVVDPNVPEHRRVWRYISSFFRKHLGSDE
jgi:acetyl esterase/lipase